MTANIIEILRFELRDWDGKSRTHLPSVNALVISDAADEIETLRAENTKLRSILTPDICAAYGL